MRRFLLLLALSGVTAACQLFPQLGALPEPELTEVDGPLPTPSQPLNRVTEMVFSTAETPNLVETQTLIIAPPSDEGWAMPFPEEGAALTFTLQKGLPLYLENFAHPDQGCGWRGVAGQVFGSDGQPVLDLVVGVGISPDEPALWSAVTGTAPAYGLGGFELQVNSPAEDESSSYWIQVFAPNGLPLSSQFPFEIHRACDQALAILNFVASEKDGGEKSGISGEQTPTLPAYP